MENDIIISDLAKNVFHVHGACTGMDGSFPQCRPQFKRFMSAQDPCLVAMEAWNLHYWAGLLSAAMMSIDPADVRQGVLKRQRMMQLMRKPLKTASHPKLYVLRGAGQVGRDAGR
jgi:transposase